MILYCIREIVLAYSLYTFYLRRLLQNELLTDAHQKRGRKGACGAIMRNSGPSIAVSLYIDHKCMIYM